MSKLFRGLIALQVLSFIALVVALPADEGKPKDVNSIFRLTQSSDKINIKQNLKFQLLN